MQCGAVVSAIVSEGLLPRSVPSNLKPELPISLMALPPHTVRCRVINSAYFTSCIAMQALGLSRQQKAALKSTWDKMKVATGELTQQYGQVLSQLQQEHVQQAQQNREFMQQIQQLPALQATQSAAHKWQWQRQQRPGRQSITSGLRELSAAQHQQQDNHQQQLQPLQQLHDAWQHEAGSQEALTQPIMAQLAAELQQEQHLRQQQQHDWDSSTTAAPHIPGPAWAGGVTSRPNAAGYDGPLDPPAAAALYPNGQAPEPNSNCYSLGPCPGAVTEAADTVSMCGSEAARGGVQSSTAPTSRGRSSEIDGLSLSGGRHLEEAQEVLLQVNQSTDLPWGFATPILGVLEPQLAGCLHRIFHVSGYQRVHSPAGPVDLCISHRSQLCPPPHSHAGATLEGHALSARAACSVAPRSLTLMIRSARVSRSNQNVHISTNMHAAYRPPKA